MTEDARERGWAAHEIEQRRAWLKLTYAERLQWLEDTKRFVTLALGAARKRRRVGADAGR